MKQNNQSRKRVHSRLTQRLLTVALGVMLVAGVIMAGIIATADRSSGQVDVVDTITLTQTNKTPNKEFFTWKRSSGGTTQTITLDWWTEIELVMDWSDESLEPLYDPDPFDTDKEKYKLKEGDYFTFVIPADFRSDGEYIIQRENAPFYDDATPKNQVGTYSVKTVSGVTTMTATFGPYVNDHHTISGTYSIDLYLVGGTAAVTGKKVDFLLNGQLVQVGSDGNIKQDGSPSKITENYEKYGSTLFDESGNPVRVTIDGVSYVVFEWDIRINMKSEYISNLVLTDTLEGGHKYLIDKTPNPRSGEWPNYLNMLVVAEYYGLDNIPKREDRQSLFPAKYYGGEFWDYLKYCNIVRDDNGNTRTLSEVNNLTVPFATTNIRTNPSYPAAPNGTYPETSGTDITTRMSLNNFTRDGKTMVIDLQNVNRPMVIEYYTIATEEFFDGDLLNNDRMKTIKNTVEAGSTVVKTKALSAFWPGDKMVAGGIMGTYSVEFTKIGEDMLPLSGAKFILYTDEACNTPLMSSDPTGADGKVRFVNLANNTYYMKESQAPDGYELSDKVYKVDVTNSSAYTISGYVDGSWEEIPGKTITNSKEPPISTLVYGSLTLEKAVDGAGANLSKLFEFTVEFEHDNETLTGILLDGAAFTNGAKVYLKDGETAEFTKIPMDTAYTITESDYSDDGYESDKTDNKSTGEITSSVKEETVTFINTYEPLGSPLLPSPAYIDLSITKKAKDAAGADVAMDADKFTFILYNSDEDGAEKSQRSTSGNAAGTGTAAASFNNIQFASTGTYYLLLKEKGPAPAYWEYDDTQYLITVDVTLDSINNKLEAEAVYSVREGGSGPFGAYSEPDLAFTNIYDPPEAPPQATPDPGSLIVSKILTGNNTQADREFTFTVTFSDEVIHNGDTSKTHTIKLKGGQSETITGIPDGVTYTVAEEEANKDGYTTASTGDAGMIQENETSEAVFTNYRNTTTTIIIPPSPTPNPEPSPSPSPEIEPDPDPAPSPEPEDDDTPYDFGTGTVFDPDPEPESPPPAPPPYIPGGNDPGELPVPTGSDNTLVWDDDLEMWVEFDEDGVPLGGWYWDDDLEMWIFDDDIPLGALDFDEEDPPDAPEAPPMVRELPQTGRGLTTEIIYLIGLSLLGIGATLSTCSKKRDSNRE